MSDAQNSLADSLMTIGNYDKAIEIYKKTESPNALVYYKIGSAHQSLGNLTKAREYYSRSLKENPDNPLTASKYAILLCQNGNYKKADSIFTRLTTIYPDNPGFYYQLGLVKDSQKDSSGIEQYRKTLQLNPTHQNALYRAAVYEYNNRQLENAETLAEQALKSYPDNENMQRLLAKIAFVSKDYRKAMERYKNLVTDDKATKEDYKNLGFSYYHLYDFKKAIEVFEELLEREEEDAEILYNLGLLYHSEGDYEKAKELFTTTISMKKFGLDKQYQSLALVYKSMENYSLAIHFFQQALAENPMLARSQYEIAVCADNYYEDKKTIRDYYQLVIDKFKNSSDASHYVNLSEHRVKDLNKELFMKGKDK